MTRNLFIVLFQVKNNTPVYASAKPFTNYNDAKQFAIDQATKMHNYQPEKYGDVIEGDFWDFNGGYIIGCCSAKDKNVVEFRYMVHQI